MTQPQERQYRECQISPSVVAWLKGKGYCTYAEVPAVRLIDHVGVRWEDESVICVEMKCSLTRTLLYQAHTLQSITPLAYMAVASKPRKASLDMAKQAGLGVIVDGAEILAPEKRNKQVIDRYKDLLLQRCRLLPQDGLGGLPQMKGDGPAIRCAAAVKSYVTEHPNAKWKEIWANVPNHYAHYRSMQGAIGPLWFLMQEESNV